MSCWPEGTTDDSDGAGDETEKSGLAGAFSFFLPLGFVALPGFTLFVSAASCASIWDPPAWLPSRKSSEATAS